VSGEFALAAFDGYLELTCSGNPDLRQLLQNIQDALACTADQDRRVLLVDLGPLDRPGPTREERYVFGRTVARLQKRAKKVDVIVFVVKLPIVDPGRLGADVARRRGARLRGFGTLEAAKAWIAEYLAARD
jgi:hypothetical protein